MRFLRRNKLREPAAAAAGKFRRFGKFRHAEHAAEKRSRVIFTSRRHRQLHVIDCRERFHYLLKSDGLRSSMNFLKRSTSASSVFLSGTDSSSTILSET